MAESRLALEQRNLKKLSLTVGADSKCRKPTPIIWILKPENLNRGHGIELYENLEDLREAIKMRS